MTTMFDLSHDLVEDILTRVPITSLGAVRSTCKLWNALSKHLVLCKTEAKHQVLGFTVMDHKLFSMSFNLHGILNEDGEEFVDPSMKPIGNSLNDQVEISKVFYCDGLLLCVTRNSSRRLVVWNPYLGQTRWIQPRDDYQISATYALGYDKNKNLKILRFFIHGYYEVYNLESDSWSFYDVISDKGSKCYQPGVSLNGNAYFLTDARKAMEGNDCLICFDFTTERFGELLSLPFSHRFMITGRLSCVNEEKLAALYQCYDTSMMEIWVTTTIEPNAVSWSQFLKIDMEPLTGLQFDDNGGSFFVDEEKKVAVVFDIDESERNNMAYIVGDNRCLKEVDLGEVVNSEDSLYSFSPLVYSCSYVPSLVQINQHAEPGRKEKKSKSKRKDKKRKRTNKV